MRNTCESVMNGLKFPLGTFSDCPPAKAVEVGLETPPPPVDGKIKPIEVGKKETIWSRETATEPQLTYQVVSVPHLNERVVKIKSHCRSSPTSVAAS